MSYKHKSFDQSEVLLELESLIKKADGTKNQPPSEITQQAWRQLRKTYDPKQNPFNLPIMPEYLRPELALQDQMSIKEIEENAKNIQNIEQALNYVLKFCEVAGAIPTPVGNPFAYVNLTESIRKINGSPSFPQCIEIFGHMLDAAPALGALGLAFKNFPKIAKIFVWMNKSLIFRDTKIITFIQNLFRNHNWKRVFNEAAFRAVLESVDKISLELKGFKISDKLTEAVSGYIAQFVSAIVSGKEMETQ
jgi:hypothetical protein